MPTILQLDNVWGRNPMRKGQTRIESLRARPAGVPTRTSRCGTL